MALNFPNAPALNDIHEEAGQKWKWNGYAWDIVEEAVAIFKTIQADSGSAEAANSEDTLTIAGGTDIGTAISGKTLTINFTGEAGGGGLENAFTTLISDDGQFTSADSTNNLTVVGGTNINTEVVTDSNQLTVNLDSFPISFLSNVSSAAATTGQVLKWDGSQWAPGVDATTGGAGTDADTLDGFDGTYYLDYTNFTNTPSVLTLSSLSIGNELVAAGNGAISYDNTTGVFRFTPPTAAGIGALTAEVNDLTAAVTWANVPDANITESSVTQHQAALSITESQISDLGTYLSSSSSINALNDVDTATTPPTDGQSLVWDNAGSVWKPATVSGGGGSQNVFVTFNADTGTTTANTTTDTLTVAGGTDISTTLSGDTLTVTYTGTPGAENFTDLGDAPSGLAPYKFHLQCFGFYEVSSSGNLAYLFSQYTGNNPTIYAISGTTLGFDLGSIPSHPFEIQDPTGNPYNTGLVHVSSNGTISTGSNAQGKTSGVLYWQVPASISGGYRYQCQSHGVMVGNIQVKSIVSV